MNYKPVTTAMLKLLKYTGQLVQPLIDFVYPPVCHHCANSIMPEEYLCVECDASLHIVEPGSEEHEELRRRIQRAESNLTDVYTLYEFESGKAFQSLIHELKYRQKTRIGIELGRRLGKTLKEQYGVDDSWILFPVPLYPSKERERGYNQSVYIAKGTARETGAVLAFSSLTRTRKTGSQTSLSLLRRRENVSGAFRLERGRDFPGGTNIAIIDDIITTGATISEIARLFPGYLNVYGFGAGYSHPEIS